MIIFHSDSSGKSKQVLQRIIIITIIIIISIIITAFLFLITQMIYENSRFVQNEKCFLPSLFLLYSLSQTFLMFRICATENSILQVQWESLFVSKAYLPTYLPTYLSIPCEGKFPREFPTEYYSYLFFNVIHLYFGCT